MGLTLVLSAAGCALLFIAVWGVTVTLPAKMLAKNFPEDVQERLQPRLDQSDNQPMSARRFPVWIILILLCFAHVERLAIGGVDWQRRGYSF